MSNIFVTVDGFEKKTFEENKLFYETEFQAIFGNDIDLEPDGAFGQLVGLFAKRDTDIWDGAEEIYNSRNPNTAVGVSLDNISAETGVIRQAEGKTSILDAFLFGTLATVIPAGSKARQSTNPDDIDYLLTNDVTISLSLVRYCELTMDVPSNGEAFTITINGTPYSYNAVVPTDTEDVVAAQLESLINAGAFAGSVVRDGATLKITQATLDYTLAYTSNITLDVIASGGDFEAEFAGANAAPSNTLDTIVTPISGWDNVSNPTSGITGRNTETDEELRIRRARTLVTGNATDDAIINAISNNVTGVGSVSLKSNRTDVTDVDGLPPHSFEAVVIGGDDADIAQQIWLTMPAGIASYGSESEIVVDSQGNNQTIYFSRPTAVYIHVKVQRDLYDEEIYPSDGDNQIKQAIVDWAAINQPIGKDVIRQRLSIPVYEISGVGNINITIDDTPNPGDTPTYAVKDIAIAIREFADFDVTRIIVEDIP